MTDKPKDPPRPTLPKAPPPAAKPALSKKQLAEEAAKKLKGAETVPDDEKDDLLENFRD